MPGMNDAMELVEPQHRGVNTRNRNKLRASKQFNLTSDPECSSHSRASNTRADGALQHKAVLGIDFGTTYSSASYQTCHSQDGVNFTNSEVKHIKNWPDDPTGMGSEEQIPTENWYSKIPLERPGVDNQFDHYRPDDRPEPEPSQDELHGTAEQGEYMLNEAMPGQGNLAQEIEEDSDEDIRNNNADNDDSSEFLWGWSARYQRHTTHSTRSKKRHISLIKLLMLEPSESRSAKGSSTRDPSLVRIQMTVDYLIRKKLVRKFGKKSTPDVRDVRDVIGDFLTHMMRHIMRQLQIHEKLNEQWTIEIILSVPVISTALSSRILSQAMRDAVLANPWGSTATAEHTASNIGLVTEPEAAITTLIPQTPDFLAGEVVVGCDIGGGTTDLISYILYEDPSNPATFKRQVINPSGIQCGGNLIDEKFAYQMETRLRGQDFSSVGLTVKTIVDDLKYDFERIHKRQVNATRPCNRPLRVPGVRPNAAQRLDVNTVHMNQTDYYDKIFEPGMEPPLRALRAYIKKIREDTGLEVHTIFLVGGTTAAPTVRSYFKAGVAQISRELQPTAPIALVIDKTKCVTAVSAGAVLRGAKKDLRTRGYALSNYYFLVHEEYDPKAEGHKTTKPKPNDYDGCKEVSVLNLFITKESTTRNGHRVEPEYGPYERYHRVPVDFDIDDFRIEEVVYVSDFDKAKSHHTLSSTMNKDRAQKAGIISVKVPSVVDVKTLEVIEPKEKDVWGRPIGKPHYGIKWDLYVVVDGLNMRYEARYPACEKKDGRVIQPTNPSSRHKGQISIAAAFKPGA